MRDRVLSDQQFLLVLAHALCVVVHLAGENLHDIAQDLGLGISVSLQRHVEGKFLEHQGVARLRRLHRRCAWLFGDDAQFADRGDRLDSRNLLVIRRVHDGLTAEQDVHLVTGCVGSAHDFPLLQAPSTFWICVGPSPSKSEILRITWMSLFTRSFDKESTPQCTGVRLR